MMRDKKGCPWRFLESRSKIQSRVRAFNQQSNPTPFSIAFVVTFVIRVKRRVRFLGRYMLKDRVVERFGLETDYPS